MPGCCSLSRRELLRWGAIVAATPLIPRLADADADDAGTAAPALRRARPMNLELVTLTETGLVLTWFTGDPTRPDDLGRPAPVGMDTEVLIGTSPTNLRTVLHTSQATAYHYAEVEGLEPGRVYYYLARSNGVAATPAPFFAGNPAGTAASAFPNAPFAVRTLHAPTGSHLFSIALCNDLHVGETVAGLAATVGPAQVPPGVTQVPGRPAYTDIMGRALAADATARGANLLLAAGDLTSEAAPGDLATAKGFLDSFGTYGSDYLVARGNHDRPHDTDETGTCSAVPGADGYHDCFRDAFFSTTEPTWWAHEVHGLRIIGLDTYDKIGTGGDNGVLSAEQMSFLRAELARDRDRPTLVVGHHPVTAESDLTSAPPLTFDMNQPQARQIERMYAKTPGVFLHHSGHTHRNKRTTSATAPEVVFQEVSAVKEYPGGFTLVRVYSGGYRVNFYKFRDPQALEWSERTRQAYFGGYPYYVAGTIRDRNYGAPRDFSGLTPA